MRDLTVEQYPTWKDPCSSNCYRIPHGTPLEPTQNAATNYDHHCTVSDCSFNSMLTHCWSCSPIKRLLNKLENSIHTYVNYHKTHTMATHFGGVGDTLVEDPKTRDIDNVSEDESQDEDLIRQLLWETANLSL